jgi:hypothetical protein
MFDVIEHVDDDVGLLEQARRALVPNGYVAVTVPAGPHLWTRYDDADGRSEAGWARRSLRGVFQLPAAAGAGDTALDDT